MERQLFNELSQFRFTYLEDDSIWFVGEIYPLIFQVCMSDLTVKSVVKIEDEKSSASHMYWNLVKVQNKIFLLPSNHNKITIYHTDIYRFSNIYLESSPVCMCYCKEGEKLYLLSNSEIIILDTIREEVSECISIPYENIIISGKAFSMGGHIYIPLIYRNQILDFCVEDRRFSCMELNCYTNGFITGLRDGTDVWLAGYNGRIVKWNSVSGKCIFYDELPDGFRSFDYDANGDFIPWQQGWIRGNYPKYWYDCFMIDDRIWFIPTVSDSLLYIEKRSNIVCQYTFENEDETELTVKDHRNVKFLFVGIQQDRYIKIYSVKRDIIYSIDAKTLKHTEEVFNIDHALGDKLENIIYNEASHHGIYEKRNITVRQMIDIIYSNDIDNNMDKLEGHAGVNIYQFLKDCSMVSLI